MSAIETHDMARRVEPETFWPPADALLETADAIRAVLGSNWPRPARQWRFCLATPAHYGLHDVRVFIDAQAHPDDERACLDAGAAIIEAAPSRVELRPGSAVYTWSGERSDDWLAALAAFAACDFDLHDALTLALAWRGEAQPADLAAEGCARRRRAIDRPGRCRTRRAQSSPRMPMR